MYFKLALKNVKKSFKDFLIYFLTLAFSVCLFYTFNSFQAQQAVMQMNDSQLAIVEMLSSLMTLLSGFVAIVLAFLILYANNFLIKRRKKELGLYTLLGMPKRKISSILVYETFIIGVTSLVVGMIAGILMSQVLTAVSAGLFEVPLDYKFVFSPLATFITLFAFGGIFALSMIFNTCILNRYKLIDLINAERKNDELKIKKVWISVVLFILSITILGVTYYVALDLGFEAFSYLIPICIAGILGTFLFFLSLAGFLLTIIKSNKRIYFKNLNCFILRQIHSNINSNFISMSIVCIMLLLSIGALSTGLSLNHTINATIKNTTPYDYSYKVDYYYTYRVEKIASTPENAEQLLKTMPIDHSQISSQNFEKIYLADIKMDDPVLTKAFPKAYQGFLQMNSELNIQAIPLSVFNQERAVRNLDPISLTDKETYLFSNVEMIAKPLQKVLDEKPTFTLYGHKVKVANDSYDTIAIGTTKSLGDNTIALVVNDDLIPSDAEIQSIYWNVKLKNGINDMDFEDEVSEAIRKVNETLPEEIYFQSVSSAIATKTEVYQNSKGLSVVFTYIGIYLGIVFMIASAVILALQQLSQASDNKKRYTILTKIGTENGMMNRSILTQIGIYFMLPLVLAIAHSLVGINVVNEVVIAFGKSDIMLSSLITAGIIIFIYGSYFLVTYMGYKNIIKN